MTMLLELYAIMLIMSVVMIYYSLAVDDKNNYSHIVAGIIGSLMLIYCGYVLTAGVQSGFDVAGASIYRSGTIPIFFYLIGLYGILTNVIGIFNSLSEYNEEHIDMSPIGINMNNIGKKRGRF
jgi:hypothetical protein